MKKFSWRWVIWLVITAILFSGGWIMKDTGVQMRNQSMQDAGRTIMSLGWALGASLLIYSAITNLKK